MMLSRKFNCICCSVKKNNKYNIISTKGSFKMVTELERIQANEVVKSELSHLLVHNNFKCTTDFGDFKSEFIEITNKGITIKFYSKDFRIENVNTTNFDDVRERFWSFVNNLLNHYITDLDKDFLIEYLFKMNSII